MKVNRYLVDLYIPCKNLQLMPWDLSRVVSQSVDKDGSNSTLVASLELNTAVNACFLDMTNFHIQEVHVQKSKNAHNVKRLKEKLELKSLYGEETRYAEKEYKISIIWPKMMNSNAKLVLNYAHKLFVFKKMNYARYSKSKLWTMIKNTNSKKDW